MNQLENYLQQHFDISAADSRLEAGVFRLETIIKGEYFLHSGSASNRLSFIIDGMLRIFVKQAGKEVTQWISTAGSFVTH